MIAGRVMQGLGAGLVQPLLAARLLSLGDLHSRTNALADQ
ncbi:uncharacterized protein METZ01_LOCUS195163, partial [marine metagenome]